MPEISDNSTMLDPNCVACINGTCAHSTPPVVDTHKAIRDSQNNDDYGNLMHLRELLDKVHVTTCQCDGCGWVDLYENIIVCKCDIGKCFKMFCLECTDINNNDAISDDDERKLDGLNYDLTSDS